MNHESRDDSLIRLDGRCPDPASGQNRIAGVLFHAWPRFKRWVSAKRAMRHLESLEDHLLDDIGIERAEIPAAVRGLLERREVLSRPAAARQARSTCHRLAA